jgi:glycerol-3-phosphate O-acyltransferase / dihydroxyacetone phosphate acyltransferase
VNDHRDREELRRNRATSDRLSRGWTCDSSGGADGGGHVAAQPESGTVTTMTEPARLQYRTIRRIGMAAARSFYQVRYFNHSAVEPDGPLVVIANHPNGGIDAVVVAGAFDAPLHFLAKSSLFNAPLLKTVLHTIGALPAFRRQDGSDTSNNVATFNATRDALAANAAICVFPEGTSHTDAHLRQLRTGAARIALDGCAAGAPVKIVPVGLLYSDRERFRSEMSVTLGPAIDVTEWLTGHGSDPTDFDPTDPELVRALTAAAERSLDAVTFTAADHELLELARQLAAARADVPGAADDPATLCTWAATLTAVDATSDGAALISELRAFFEQLNELGLTPSDLAVPHPTLTAASVLTHVAATAAEIPVAVYGSVAGAVPFHVTHGVYNIAGKRGVGAATTKIVAAAVLYPAWGIFVWRMLHRRGLNRWQLAAVTAAGWTAHLAARPLWNDQGRRWRRNLVAVRLLRSPSLADRLHEATIQLDGLVEALAENQRNGTG